MNLSTTFTKLESIQNCNIGIEVDFPNIHIGLKHSKWPNPFEYETIENFALKYGNIYSSRIYADWKDYLSERNCLSRGNTELIQVDHINVMGEKNRRKDLVDTLMSFNICAMMYENPELNLVIIVSGDADFIPVISSIKERGKKVIIIAAEGSMSEYLGKYADYTINYEYIASLE